MRDTTRRRLSECALWLRTSPSITSCPPHSSARRRDSRNGSLSAIRVGAHPGGTPLAGDGALYQPEPSTLIELDVDDDDGSLFRPHAYDSEHVGRLHLVFRTRRPTEIVSAEFPDCADWPPTDDKKMLDSWVRLFIHCADNISKHDFRRIDVERVGRPHPERQSSKGRIRCSRQGCSSLRQ